MKRLKIFPLSIVAKSILDYSKVFHSKIFTLAASSESLVYTYAHEYNPHFNFCYVFFRNDEGYWIGDYKSAIKIRRWIIHGARNGTGHVMRIYRAWQEDWINFTAVSQKLLRINLQTLTDHALFDLFSQFYNLYLRAGSVAYCTDSFASTGEHDWLEALVQKELRRLKIRKDQAATVRLLTSPAHLSFTLEEEHNLLKLAAQIAHRYPSALPPLQMLNRRASGLYRALKFHERRFFWIRNNYHHVEYMDVADIYRRIGRLFNEAKRKGISVPALSYRKQKEWEEFCQKRTGLLNSLPLSPFIKNVLKIAKLFTKWKDVRKSGVCIGMHHFDQFLMEIGRRLKIPKRDLSFLYFDEVREAFLERKDFEEEIATRKKQAFFAVTPRGYFIVGGRKAAPYFKYFMRGQPTTEVRELRGVAASPGRVRGRVRVIRKTEEMRTFKKGEILVTNQTTPEFMPIMKKAAAIVTEQGGITSHAAVVSRELHRPCVIGTKIATEVLKDGDLVEVNANHGVVTVLERK